jgi:hypothetical protein
MASRPHTTYKKRQKELARMEKQRDKAAKRMQRKLEKKSPDADGMIEGEEGIEGIEGEEGSAPDSGDVAATDEQTP